jgi:hypothetical protein
MSADAGLTFSADWSAMLDALDPAKFSGRVRQESKTLMNRIGRMARRHAIAIIKAGAYQHNAPSTIRSKGSSLPLVDNGDLMASINFSVDSGPMGVSGLILGANKRSEKGHNIALTLHGGTKPGTKPIIPARPFLATAIQTQRFKAEANAAIAATMLKILSGKRAKSRKKFVAGLSKRFGF